MENINVILVARLARSGVLVPGKRAEQYASFSPLAGVAGAHLVTKVLGVDHEFVVQKALYHEGDKRDPVLFLSPAIEVDELGSGSADWIVTEDST